MNFQIILFYLSYVWYLFGMVSVIVEYNYKPLVVEIDMLNKCYMIASIQV